MLRNMCRVICTYVPLGAGKSIVQYRLYLVVLLINKWLTLQRLVPLNVSMSKTSQSSSSLLSVFVCLFALLVSQKGAWDAYSNSRSSGEGHLNPCCLVYIPSQWRRCSIRDLRPTSNSRTASLVAEVVRPVVSSNHGERQPYRILSGYLSCAAHCLWFASKLVDSEELPTNCGKAPRAPK